MSALQRWQRTDRRCVRRVVAQVTVRHPQDPLPIVPLAAFRDDMTVGKQAVHRRQAGRSLVADPGDLDRRRLAGKYRQPVVGGVSRQVEKDVDAVLPDLLRQPLVARAHRVAPLGRGGLQAASHFVLEAAVGVADRLDLLLVEVLQDADQKIADGVFSQIGRNESQAEPALPTAEAAVPDGSAAEGAAYRRSYSAWASAKAAGVTPAQ